MGGLGVRHLPLPAPQGQDPERSNEEWAKEQQFDNAPYHGRTSQAGPQGVKSAAPADGPAALRNSFRLSDTTTRRIGHDAGSGQFVVLDRTRDGLWHGHVRTWDELNQAMCNALIRNGVTSPRGKIIRS